MRYVLAVAEEHSFTRAAEKCHVVQSALSHQIKALEKELGLQLFARTSRKVEPTAAGLAFIAAARESLAAADRASTQAAAAAGLVQGQLALGLIPTVTTVDIPKVLAQFHELHPSVRISLKQGSSDAFMEDIAAGRLDAAILGLSDTVEPAKVQTRVLARERAVALLPPKHRLAGRQQLRLEELANERFADFPAGTPGRRQSDIAFAQAGLAREVAFEASSSHLLLGLVEHSLAVALLPPAAIPAGSQAVKIEVADGPGRVEYLAWSGFNASPAARAFIDLVP